MAVSHTCFINKLAYDRIRGFLGTIGEDGKYLNPIFQSSQSQSSTNASDYRDRFLYELIQNAYDAHPLRTQDGQIKIILDKSVGKNGTLFVANFGRPFSEDDVRSLCDIGLSQKPLGESIGNKGLGFRSVVQITDKPIIYSQCPLKPKKSIFTGFCFRFAERKDYQKLINDENHLTLALSDLPPFHIPICVEQQSKLVRSYASDFSSLIELPLRDSEALDAVNREIKHFAEQHVPMLLFLDRVATLHVQIIDDIGNHEMDLQFTRNEENIALTDIRISRVDLGGAGKFLVAHDSIPEKSMKDAIKTGIDKKELNKYWDRWSGNGEVAVAVRLDSQIRSSRLFSFLPLGDQATAPFFGYIHGNFVPSANRLSLDSGIKLNAALLMASATLAAEVIHNIITNSSDTFSNKFSDKERATAVIDLLCWTDLGNDNRCVKELTQRLVKCFGVDSLEQVPLLPCQKSETDESEIEWKPSHLVRRWTSGGSVFSADVCLQHALEIGIWPIWEVLGDRIDALEKFLKANMDCYFGPPCGEERAKLVSIVAKTINESGNRDMDKWRRYFLEIPDFMDGDAQHLGGLEILLDSAAELLPAMPLYKEDSPATQSTPHRKHGAKTAVFSPPDPKRVSDDDSFKIEPPKKLSRRFAFLNTDLSWHDELRKVRTYLEEHKLVQQFDREDVLAHLSRTLHKENNKEILKEGLRWAFKIWRQPRSQGRTFKLQSRHQFRVPVMSGNYVKADEATFSADWPPDTEGQLVQNFLDAAPIDLSDLVQLANCRLVAPDHPAFNRMWIDDWVNFLTELGVNKGLTPVKKYSNKKFSPMSFPKSDISNFSFLDTFGIPPQFGSLWREDILAEDVALLEFRSSTNYEINNNLLFWLPGQADVDQFSADCKVHYARLIMGWLSRESHPQWEIDIHHEYHYKADRRRWPSPIKSFLRSAHWFPLLESTKSSSKLRGAKPCEVWVNNAENERFEKYLPVPPHELKICLQQAKDTLIQSLSIHLRLRILDDPKVLGKQLEFLAKVYERDEFLGYYRPRLLTRYRKTWQLLIRTFQCTDQKTNPIEVPENILAQRGQQIQRVVMHKQGKAAIEEYVYVCDTDKESDSRLIEKSGHLSFSLKHEPPDKVGKLLEKFYGQRIKRLSKISVELRADGKDINTAVTEPMNDICPQLRTMLAVGMESLSGMDEQQLPTDRSTILTRLDRLTVIKAKRISFTVDGMEITDEGKENAFHFESDKQQSIIVVQSSSEWNWKLIDVCIPAVCEAVKHKSLELNLRLLIAHCFRKEQTLQETPFSHSLEDLERYSEILNLSDLELSMARATLRSGMELQIPWIRAVLHFLVGPTKLDAFDARLDLENDEILISPDLLHNILAPLIEDSHISAEEIINVSRIALGADDFLNRLNLDFAGFNSSLNALGLEAITYPDIHKLCLEKFVREKELAITDCLRALSVNQLKFMKPAEGYAKTRDSVRTLKPDSDWLTIYKEPPPDVLEEHINVWLVSKGAPRLGDFCELPESLVQVRETNRQFINEFVKDSEPIVLAWHRKFKSKNPEVPIKLEYTNEHIQMKLDDVGVVDFCKLNKCTIMQWFQVLGIWPAGMPLSINLKELSLAEEDLSKESNREREESELRKRENRSIPFNGRMVDPQNSDLFALSKELHNKLSPKFKNMPLNPDPKLAKPKVQPSTKSGSTSEGNQKGRRTNISEEKMSLIGQLGELVVYHWLRQKFPKQDIDKAWRSKNSTQIANGEGNDSLGYDFEVIDDQKKILQIEVKAHLNDPQSFEMGETQVKAAQKAAQSRSGIKYIIAYVSNVSDTHKTNIEIIPNPMTDEGARVVQILGQGIRYRFGRSTG